MKTCPKCGKETDMPFHTCANRTMKGEERFLRNLAIKSAYLEGQPASMIGRAHGIHEQTVFQVLRRMGVKRRRRGAPRGHRPETILIVIKARELRRLGHTYREIGAAFGFTRQRAQQLLAK